MSSRRSRSASPSRKVKFDIRGGSNQEFPAERFEKLQEIFGKKSMFRDFYDMVLENNWQRYSDEKSKLLAFNALVVKLQVRMNYLQFAEQLRDFYYNYLGLSDDDEFRNILSQFNIAK